MPTIQFKGKSIIETYHHTVPHHRLEFVPKLSGRYIERVRGAIEGRCA